MKTGYHFIMAARRFVGSDHSPLPFHSSDENCQKQPYMPASTQMEPTGLSKRPELRFYIPGSLSLRQLFKTIENQKGTPKSFNVNPMSVLHSDGRRRRSQNVGSCVVEDTDKSSPTLTSYPFAVFMAELNPSQSYARHRCSQTETTQAADRHDFLKNVAVTLK